MWANKAVGGTWPAGSQFMMTDIESQRDQRHNLGLTIARVLMSDASEKH